MIFREGGRILDQVSLPLYEEEHLGDIVSFVYDIHAAVEVLLIPAAAVTSSAKQNVMNHLVGGDLNQELPN